MDKYKTLKRLVLFNALFSVLCFFLPIVWLNGIENIGLGFSFVIGITVSKPSSPLYQDSYLAYVQSARLYEWLMRISFILAIASLVLAVLLFIKKYNNGSNKKKVDITILVSVALSLVSALLIFSILPISISIRGVVSPEGFYGYEPIITFVITAVIAVLFVKSKREIATAEGAPQGEKTKKVKSKGEKELASTGAPDSPIGKPLDWFSSEAGLEVYKAYITPQNYILEESYLKKYEEKCSDQRLDFDDDFLPIFGPDAKLPHTFFNAMINNIDVDAMQYKAIRSMLIKALEEQAKPFVINDDGEPEPREMPFTPEQLLSVDKNPLLYFVKNFDAFKIENDGMGTADDKYHTYAKALMFISAVSDEISLEGKEKWLLDKSTYLNDFGIVRKEKGFIKKCMECTENANFIALFAAMLGGVDSWKGQREQAAAAERQAQERTQQAYEQRQQAEEQRRFNEEQAREQRRQAEEQRKLAEKQIEEQKKNAQMMACAASTCPNCRRQCGMSSYVPAGNSGCACFIKK